MSYVTETPSWPAGVYQLEVTDPVQGGSSGVANQPSKDLASRTVILACLTHMNLFKTTF